MSAWISTENTAGFDRIIIEEDSDVGFYIYVYATPESRSPERDHLQDSFAMAKYACTDDYGVPATSWQPYSGPPVGG